jgi:hypothetical protein
MGKHPISQSPTVLSPPGSLKKEKRGAQKERAVNNLGNPTSKTDCSLNNEPSLSFGESRVSPRASLKSKKEMVGGRIVLILRSDIMEFRKEVRPTKLKLKV